MKNAFIIAATLLILVSPLSVFAFQAGAEGCSSDCSTCHSLTEKEAAELLKLKDVRISDSPAKGIWQVEGMQKGNRVRVYLDFAKKHVMLISRFIPVDTIGKPPEVRKLDLKDIPLTGTVLVGSKKAKHKVIVFSDPDCSYCRKLHEEIKKVIKKRKDIAFYIKLFPLPMHKEAYGKSKAILCEKSIELLDAAFEGKPVPEAKCFIKEVDANIETAKKLGITGTPGIILPDGTLIPGYLESAALIAAIDDAAK